MYLLLLRSACDIGEAVWQSQKTGEKRGWKNENERDKSVCQVREPKNRFQGTRSLPESMVDVVKKYDLD